MLAVPGVLGLIVVPMKLQLKPLLDRLLAMSSKSKF